LRQLEGRNRLNLQLADSGMIDTIRQLDEELFLLLNGAHCTLCDTLMWYASKMWMWAPIYAWMVFMLFSRKSKLNAVIALLCIACLLFLTDFVAVKTVKETVMRLRPTHNPRLQGLVHMVQDELGNYYKGGRYGFFSNHASNFAGVTVFFVLLMKPMSRWVYAALAAWVVLIGYSRIYLGVHYPLDILAGFAYGTLAGLFIYWLYGKFEKREVAA
jgi:undecaprenyl-diphosphatase